MAAGPSMHGRVSRCAGAGGGVRGRRVWWRRQVPPGSCLQAADLGVHARGWVGVGKWGGSHESRRAGALWVFVWWCVGRFGCLCRSLGWLWVQRELDVAVAWGALNEAGPGVRAMLTAFIVLPASFPIPVACTPRFLQLARMRSHASGQVFRLQTEDIGKTAAP